MELKTTKYPGTRILTGGSSEPLVVSGATVVDDKLEATLLSGDVLEFVIDGITINRSAGTLAFEASGEEYNLRGLRETDGLWLSKYQTVLPMDALNQLVLSGKTGVSVENANNQESLVAYALDDSVYVVGLVYQNGVHRYLRAGGDWTLLSPEDDIHQSEDVFGMYIDPARADEYIKLYDKYFVTVTDTEGFEVDADEVDAENIQPKSK